MSYSFGKKLSMHFVILRQNLYVLDALQHIKYNMKLDRISRYLINIFYLWSIFFLTFNAIKHELMLI